MTIIPNQKLEERLVFLAHISEGSVHRDEEECSEVKLLIS